MELADWNLMLLLYKNPPLFPFYFLDFLLWFCTISYTFALQRIEMIA